MSVTLPWRRIQDKRTVYVESRSRTHHRQMELDVTAPESKAPFGARQSLTVGDASHEVFRLDAVKGSERLPYSLKILLENLLRTEDGANITADHVHALASWDPAAEPSTEIQFTPGRGVMHDFTGVQIGRAE